MSNKPKDGQAASAGSLSPTPSGAYDATTVEAKWTEFWFANKLFDLNIKTDSKNYYSGALPPPNITGNLHMGHALNGTLQDVLFRYKRMQGFNVLWQPGTDHAGISTQMVVERDLRKQGISRFDLGREKFLEATWKWRHQYGNAILSQYKRLGVSFSWDRIAFTMDDGYVKAVIKVFVELFNDGLIYRGRRVVNWCPRCLTSLSDLEVQHEEKKGFIYIINYPLADESGGLQVATTRPETMFADVAVAVHPEDDRYKKFVGKKVKLPLTDRLISVIADSYVDREFGTGVLKITPAHDPNDFEVGQRHNLEMPMVIDENGKLMADPLVPLAYHGKDRFEIREQTVVDLKERDFLIEAKEHNNAITLCERCQTVLEPRLSDQWYMSMKELVKPAIAAVEKKEVVFIPERYSATYLDWMSNIRDWCISRQLWWGQRIPIWTCGKCNAIAAYEQPPESCHKCHSKEIEQDPDVLDTWFSSGLWPFVTLGWPEKTIEMEKFYPTDILVTAREIINLWVSRMIFFSIKMVKQIPFKYVLIHPVIQTADGKRMSKSKGNVIDPLDMIEKYGADANRFWFTTVGIKGDQDVRFREDKLEEYKRFVNKLWNAGRFVIGKMSDQKDLSTKIAKENLSLPDRWILSAYNKLLISVEESYKNYDYQIVANDLYQFTWDYFCDWYLEISKISASQETNKVLYQIFEGLLRALHPVMPFVTDELWDQFKALGQMPKETQNLKSIMFAPYPKGDKALIDNQAEEKMGYLMRLIRSIRNIRQVYNVPHTAPLDAVYESSPEETQLLKDNLLYIETIARVKLIEKSSLNKTIDRCASDTIDQTTIYVPLSDVIDVQKTVDKLLQRKQSLEKEWQKGKQILDNAEFKSKAPPEKVNALEEQLKAAETNISHIQNQIKVLS
jgi:valyl-tRNA synthetase